MKNQSIWKNQWLRLNLENSSLKVLLVSLSISVATLSFLYFKTLKLPPVVIMLDDHKQISFAGKRLNKPIDEKDIEDFVKEFIFRRYKWENLNSDQIYLESKPLLTADFSKKLKSEVFDLQRSKLKEKKAKQDVAHLFIKIDKDKILAKFDKILRVDNIPLPIPTELAFNLITGLRTKPNPWGLYIKGLMEHSRR